MPGIINFSEAASIGLHGMILIARSKSHINVIQIAEQLHSSKHHVAKIMQRLVKEDFISSFRGPTGGFVMEKKPEEITFLQIFEAIEGKLKITSCPFENEHLCGFEKCILNNITSKMTADFKEYMERQTLDLYI
jgi:Rrf2 family protein